MNKPLPGLYINTESSGQSVGTVGERGIVAYPAPLPWGADLIVIDSSSYFDDALRLLGFHPDDARIRHITAATTHARRVLLYRLGGDGQKATATSGALTATAKYAGLRGNDLKIIVQNNIDDNTKFDVYTYLEGEQLDTQTVADVTELKDNDFVTFSGTGAPDVTAGVNLTGGSAGTGTAGEISNALSRFEAEEFNVIGIPIDETTVKQLVTAWVKRLREDEGKKITAVVVNYPQADYEGITSLRNGIITEDGLQVEPIYLLWEIAAMEAAANLNESLTYQTIPGAVDAWPKLTTAETITAVTNGELVISSGNGRAYIQQDINTFTSFTPKKARERSKNRIVRVLDGIANDAKRIFETYYIGKVDNNADGRALLRKEIVTYLDRLQEIAAIQNFDAQTDITVLPGKDADAVFVDLSVQPVDSIEKIYMRIRVR
ncbi:phage tail sheath family protein [Paenibacillus sp. BR1-192]|uniref:phage tail sheath family protein n=1 Tax=Paenibacillus sp. BR1-192 TaxID=3032287 RepID=UPI00240D85D9|nr:phage tail sheath family protein [Paenibacillus sp. BR1-192]WFB60577.1 phage tail sheath family protein [Paenibacillus sp. BR1-192]